MTRYPNKQKAEELWQQSWDSILNEVPKRNRSEEYGYHTKAVGIFAEKIASAAGLDPEKAYVLGLLHDYGKIVHERSTGKFHGLSGYQLLSDMGYHAVAKVCLTHTFVTQDFETAEFINYPAADIVASHQIISTMVYDDYDRLIQLADRLAEAKPDHSPSKLEDRAADLFIRYKLPDTVYNRILQESLFVKNYFDTLCGADIYAILGID